MDEARRNEIAYQFEKLSIRKNFSFRQFDDAKRRIGNLVKEPEMVAKKVTEAELFAYAKTLVREVFEKQMASF